MSGQNDMSPKSGSLLIEKLGLESHISGYSIGEFFFQRRALLIG
jgi:hypothetical protein